MGIEDARATRSVAGEGSAGVGRARDVVEV